MSEDPVTRQLLDQARSRSAEGCVGDAIELLRRGVRHRQIRAELLTLGAPVGDLDLTRAHLNVELAPRQAGLPLLWTSTLRAAGETTDDRPPRLMATEVAIVVVRGSRLDALDAATGAPLWSATLEASPERTTIVGDAVAVATGEELQTFDLWTGERFVRSGPGGVVLFVGPGILISADGPALSARRLESLRTPPLDKAWTVVCGRDQAWVSVSATRGQLLAHSRHVGSEWPMDGGGTLHAIDPRTGDLRWSRPARAVAHDDDLVVVNAQLPEAVTLSDLVAYGLDGTLLWKREGIHWLVDSVLTTRLVWSIISGKEKTTEAWYDRKSGEPVEAPADARDARDGSPARRVELSGRVVLLEGDAVRCLGSPSVGAPLTDVRDVEGDSDEQGVDHDAEVARHPDEPEVWCARAAFRAQRGDPTGAIADATRAIELDPSNSEAWAERGRARLSGGDPTGAIADLTKAYDLDPSNPYALSFRADAHEDAGDYPSALADCTKAIELDPECAISWQRRGVLKVHRLDDVEGAMADLSRATELDPTDAASWTELGCCRLAMDALAEAEDALTKAITLEPGSARAQKLLAATRQARGDGPRADDDLSLGRVSPPGGP